MQGVTDGTLIGKSFDSQHKENSRVDAGLFNHLANQKEKHDYDNNSKEMISNPDTLKSGPLHNGSARDDSTVAEIDLKRQVSAMLNKQKVTGKCLFECNDCFSSRPHRPNLQEGAHVHQQL